MKDYIKALIKSRILVGTILSACMLIASAIHGFSVYCIGTMDGLIENKQFQEKMFYIIRLAERHSSNIGFYFGILLSLFVIYRRRQETVGREALMCERASISKRYKTFIRFLVDGSWASILLFLLMLPLYIFDNMGSGLLRWSEAFLLRQWISFSIIIWWGLLASDVFQIICRKITASIVASILITFCTMLCFLVLTPLIFGNNLNILFIFGITAVVSLCLQDRLP